MGVVLRFGYAPLRGFIETIGAIVLLFRRNVVSALTLPFNYGPELIEPVPVRAAAGMVSDDDPRVARAYVRARRD
jgi:hypothetical protein